MESPEARSSVGCFEADGEGELSFVPGRLHLGALREIDTEIGALQIMCLPSFEEVISDYQPEESITVAILREGQILGLQKNLHRAATFEVSDNVMISVSHVKDPRGHKGLRTVVDYYKHETDSADLHKVKLVVAGDSIAGGRNILEALRKVGEDFPNIESVVIVSIHASLAGVERIIEHASERIKQIRVFCLSAALAASAENHYDCFMPAHRPESLPDPRDLLLMEAIYGEGIVDRMPFAGNWTANFLTPLVARRVFEDQLWPFGLEPNDIPVQLINEETICGLGFQMEDLLPYSTLEVKAR